MTRFPRLITAITISLSLLLFLNVSHAIASPSWEFTSAMLLTREFHTLTMLSSGKVLAVGSTSTATELYNPSTHAWDFTGFLNTGHTGHTAHNIIVNGQEKVLILGGSTSSVITNKTELYDPISGQWSNSAPMNISRSLHASVKLSNGEIIVTGGTTGSTNTKVVEIYSPQTNSWSIKSDSTVARRSHTATVLNDGRVLITGGIDPAENSLNSSEIYNPLNNTWTLGPTMLNDRSLHTATLLSNGKVLLVGGVSGGLRSNTSELFDPATNSFSGLATMNNRHNLHTATLIKDSGMEKVLVTGDSSPSPTSQKAELYDPLTNSWTEIANLNTGRSRHAAILLKDGSVLISAGRGDAGLLRSAEIYTPDTTAPSPTPFLKLPWNYQSSGKSFEDVALNPNSWFDHEYPLQNIPCCTNKVTTYIGHEVNDAYRSHSGYDYGAPAGVKLNTDVLAAASGLATFTPASQSAGAGNMIKIDHGNGYQTWYEHLSSDGLIVSQIGESAHVNQGDVIGNVGMTGNTDGPHIHLSIFKDANENNTFTDDYPFGLIDPLGWEGKNPDPWEQWTQIGRTGAKSYSLFIDRKKPVSQLIPLNGGTIQDNNVTVSIPSASFDTPVKITVVDGPFDNISQRVKSIAPSFFLNAFNESGQEIHTFNSQVTIQYNYSSADLSNINENSLKMYFYNEEVKEWQELPSTIDANTKTITATTNHFTQFAVMGSVNDLLAPETSTIITGDKGEANWYRSNVNVELLGKDNTDGIGLEYTLYSLDGENWNQYTLPLTFTEEGEHTIIYQSFDKADNREQRKSLTFTIDKTAPEMELSYGIDGQKLVVKGLDSSTNPTITKQKINLLKNNYIVTDKAGNTLTLKTSGAEIGKQVLLSLDSLTYNSTPTINLNKHALAITYADKNNQITLFNQYFQVHNDKKTDLLYIPKKDQTQIISINGKGNKVTEIKDGLWLLKLITDKGVVKYSTFINP